MVPIPHHQLESQLSDPALVAKYDNMSIADRINEAVAAGLLDDQELAFIVPWVELSWGTTTDRCSFLELVKWFVLGNSTYSVSVLPYYSNDYAAEFLTRDVLL